MLPSWENLWICSCCALWNLRSSSTNGDRGILGGCHSLPPPSTWWFNLLGRMTAVAFCVPFTVENITLSYKWKPTISSGLTQRNWNLRDVGTMAILSLLKGILPSKMSPKFRGFSKRTLNLHDSSLYMSTLELYLPSTMWLYLKMMGARYPRPSVHYSLLSSKQNPTLFRYLPLIWPKEDDPNSNSRSDSWSVWFVVAVPAPPASEWWVSDRSGNLTLTYDIQGKVSGGGLRKNSLILRKRQKQNGPSSPWGS